MVRGAAWNERNALAKENQAAAWPLTNSVAPCLVRCWCSKPEDDEGRESEVALVARDDRAAEGPVDVRAHGEVDAAVVAEPRCVSTQWLLLSSDLGSLPIGVGVVLRSASTLGHCVLRQ